MFSMCSLLYSANVTLNTTSNARPPTGMADDNLAQQLRTHAVDAYSFAMNATTALYPLSVPDAGAAYNSSSYEDDLVSGYLVQRFVSKLSLIPHFQTLAAFSLALLTNSTAYYTEALEHYRNFSTSTVGGAMNWDSREPAIYILLVDIALARPEIAVSAGLATNLTGWRAQAEGYLDGILAGETNRPYFTNGLFEWRCLVRADKRAHTERLFQVVYYGTKETPTRLV